MSGQSLRMTSTFNRAAAVGVWIACGCAAVLALWSGAERLLWVYPGAALGVVLGWIALWRPYVAVSDAGVAVQNVTHRVLVPWEALVLVDTRRALSLRTPRATFTAWSAPAPGFLTAMFATGREVNREARAAGAATRHGDLIGSDSGNAAVVIREQWRARLDAGTVRVGVADEITVRREWELGLPTLAAVLGIVTVWVLIVTA